MDSTGKYVYVIRGLRLEGEYDQSPCKEKYISRWSKVKCQGENTIFTGATADTLVAAIRSQRSLADSNPKIVDVAVSTWVASNVGAECSASKATSGKVASSSYY